MQLRDRKAHKKEHKIQQIKANRSQKRYNWPDSTIKMSTTLENQRM